MDETQTTNSRARLQALLAIPERQRTDEQWDEINELEIMLASGNRQGAPGHGGHGGHGGRGNAQSPGGQPRQGGGQPRPGGGQPRPGGGQHRGQRSGRKFHQRPPKQR